MKFIITYCLLIYLGLGLAIRPAFSQDSSMPADAAIYIIWPHDQQVIRSGKLWLRMGLRNAGIAPAGVTQPRTGHHHLLIDTDLPPLDAPIPADKNHLHFGSGQTEVRLELPSGQHTLQLLLGDANHMPHHPPLYSQQITITVPEP
jgi:hypothetical protein